VLYFKYVKILLKSAMQYRLSMWLTLCGQFFISFFAFAGVYLLFERFDTIAGWTFGEVAMCFAVVQTSFSITECYARGFDIFRNLIVSGDFDRVLLRPRGTVLQVFGSSFEITRMGRLLQSFVVFGLAVSYLEVSLTPMKIVTLLLMILSGVCIFTGVFILGATVCFFTIEGLEFVNIFTDGGREIASYPLTIYNKWLMRFFTFVIPFGSFNYMPLMYVVGKAGGNEALYMLSPLLGMVFVLPCLWVWRFGVGRYLSTGN
jgi:ABC-2 type transport system permease protein